MAIGSIVNYAKSNTAPIKPEPGMGATILLWSDRHPYTIHRVSKDGKKLWATEDQHKRLDNNGFSESQEYEYWNDDSNDPESWSLFTLRKDGRWHQGNTLRGSVLAIGRREEYYDFSF